MTIGHPIDEKEVLICAAEHVFDPLLCQLEKKSLLVIDEHGALFEAKPPIPEKQAFLTPLMLLNAWNEERKGARVVLTGTAHAKFEQEYLKNGMQQWLEFVTPLSDNIFDKLLNMNSILSRLTISNKVKKITNNVPRELVKMAKYVDQDGNPSDQDVLSQIKIFKKDWCNQLLDSTVDPCL